MSRFFMALFTASVLLISPAAMAEENSSSQHVLVQDPHCIGPGEVSVERLRAPQTEPINALIEAKQAEKDDWTLTNIVVGFWKGEADDIVLVFQRC